MGGQPAEQIIAGVVLSERLAVTPYGAIHRAQWNGQRNLRGLVVDPRLLDETAFRDALTDSSAIASAIAVSHPSIVPIVTVESGGADVVVVTRGVGRYVTMQDLIVAARASRSGGGKLAPPVAAAIGKHVIEGLTAAHAAKLVHGAVHPRSVLIDEDGAVTLGDFVVGRALAIAVAQGADAALWRGISGYLAPELVVGEDPTPGCDVYAAGALLFSMISGEAPPGPLRSTPAVERLVQRALDTDPSRRYKTAAVLLENLLEAFEDDRWTLADRAEVVAVAGLSGSSTAIDDATEDLLASLGSATTAVQVTRHSAHRLDALLADLDDSARPAASRAKPRVPSLDDPDDEEDSDTYTPLPPPARESDADVLSGSSPALRSTSESGRQALDSLTGLDEPPLATRSPRARARSEPRVAEPAPEPELAIESAPAPRRDPHPVRPVARPVVEPVDFSAAPAPRLKSRLRGLIGVLVIAGAAAGFFVVYRGQVADREAAAKVRETKARELAEQARRMDELQATQGAIRITSTPADASVWLKLGRTPVDSIALPSSQLHELRIENLDGFEPVDTQVLPASWSGAASGSSTGGTRVANVVVPLTATQADSKGRRIPTKLPAMPPKPPTVTGFTEGRGSIHVESTPRGAEVWLLVGVTNNAELSGIEAGVAYELRVLKDGFRPAYITVSGDDWRAGGDPKEPLAVAKKKAVVEKAIELAPERGR